MAAITRGRVAKAQKVLVYGPEGVGKTLFAAEFPGAAFIDTEGSTEEYDHIARFPRPQSWTELLGYVAQAKASPEVGTLVIDTADWAEKLCARHLCAKYKWDGLESLGYGKGYAYLCEEWARFLDALSDVRDSGRNVVLTAHAQLAKFEQPDERGAYDRWSVKLYDGKNKSNARATMEWADAVLFANYKTFVEMGDGGKAKARGQERMMWTQHNACWDAKNRWGLPECMPLDYAGIAQHVTGGRQTAPGGAYGAETASAGGNGMQAASGPQTAAERPVRASVPSHWAAAAPLMAEIGATPEEVRAVSATRGHWTPDTPVENIPEDYIMGCVIPNWATFRKEIMEARDRNEPVPF